MSTRRADLPEFGGREGGGYQVFWDLNQYGAQMARERRIRPRDDLMGHIVRAKAGGRSLSDEEVGIYFQLLVTAGIETTGTATTQGMWALLNHPEQLLRWTKSFETLAATAVDELVRYTTPIIHFARTATKDLALGGQRVTAGDKVVIWYNSSNRDAAQFTDPDKLGPGRTHNPHHGFGGGGRHFCLGANLARVEKKANFSASPVSIIRSGAHRAAGARPFPFCQRCSLDAVSISARAEIMNLLVSGSWDVRGYRARGEILDGARV